MPIPTTEELLNQKPKDDSNKDQGQPLSIGDRANDVINSVNAGIGTAFHETAKAGVHLGLELVEQGENFTNQAFKPEFRSNITGELRDAYDQWDKETRANDGSDYKSKTVVGGFAGGVSQFVTGFIGAGKVLRGVGALKNTSNFAKAYVAGAAADAVAFDPTQDRLSNLFNDFAESHPHLRNPITDYLAADENDSEAEGRLKNALEGGVAGAAIDGLFFTIKSLRKVFKVREKEGIEAANKKWAELAEEVEYQNNPNKKPRGFSEGEIGKGEQPPVPDKPVDDGRPVELIKEDDSVTYGGPKDDPYNKTGPLVDAENRAVRSIEKPLLPKAEIDFIIEQVKNNPDWLTQGEVRIDGNYNFSRLDTDDGTKLALEEISKQVTPILDAGHRYHKSFDAIKSSAEFLGQDPGKLLVDLQAAYKSTKEIESVLVAGRAMVTGLAQKAANLARQVESNPGVMEELNKVLQQTANVDKLVRGIRSSTARATASGNIRVAANLTPAELKALQGASPEQFLKIVREPSLWTKALNMHNEYWINSILSGPRTHIKNIVSNAINTVALPAERIIGGILLRNKEQIRAGAATYMGLRSAVLDSIVLASKASGLTDAVKNISTPSKLLDVARETGDSILDPKNVKLDVSTRAITGDAVGASGRIKTTIDLFGEFIRAPGRFLTAEDEFFKQLNYRAKVFSDASQEGIDKGLKGDRLAAYIESRTNNAFNGLGNATDEAALAYARRSTFTSAPEPGSFIHSLEAAAGKHPAIRLLMPFIRTPTNILKEAALRTPGLSLLSKRYREALAGALGKEAQAQAVGQMATGAMLWTAALTFALEGNITGRGPADPREKQILLETGWRPYSFKLGNSYYSFEGFDPVSMFFGIAGDFADAHAHMEKGVNSEVISSMLVAMANNVTSKTYLQGLTQVMEALTQPERKLHSFLKNRVGSYVPSGLKQVAGLIPGAEDPYLRETRSVLDSVMNRTPGFSQLLPPRRNIFGDAVTATKALGPDSISPFYYSQQKEDVVSQELARFSHAFSAPSPKIGNIDLTQFKNAKGQDFYDRWQEQLINLKRGRYTLRERLEHLVQSEAYKKWRKNEPDAIEVGADPRTLKEVRAVIEEYRQEARRKTLAEFPEVAELVKAQKKAQVRANAGAEIPDVIQNFINQFNPQ